MYKRIKEIADKKKIQQKEIAEALNVGTNTVNNWFQENTSMKAEQIPLIAKILRVRIDQLFQKVGTPLNASYKLEDNMDVVEEAGPCPLCAEKDKRILDKEEIIKGLKGQIELLGFQRGNNLENG